MGKMELYEACEACPQRNATGIINADGNDACLIAQKLIEDDIEGALTCGGLYLPKEYNSQKKISGACHES